MREVKVQPLAGKGSPAIVHAGSWVQRVPCLLDPDAAVLSLPERVLGLLGLAPGDTVHAMEQEEGRHIYLGPLVGVLLHRRQMEAMRKGAKIFRQMAREARSAGTVTIFSAFTGVDRKSGRVQGLMERGGDWVPATLPLPDIMYNRATYPDLRERAAARAVRNRLADRHGVAFLNSVNSFGKWDGYAALRFFPQTARLVPDTVRFDGQDALSRMLARYPMVYVKADQSSHGSHVLRVRVQGGGWEVKGRIGGRTVSSVFTHQNALYAFLAGLRRRRDWVVQQGIHLPQVDGRIFDLRVIAQKDGQGEWVVPLILVRLGGRGRVAANTSQGGERFLVTTFLKRYGAKLPKLAEVEQTAETVVRQVAPALESSFGLLGEVGIDVGFDRDGRPWVFEANTKPRHSRMAGVTDPLVRYPFRYAVYLAARQWAGRHTGLAWPQQVH